MPAHGFPASASSRSRSSPPAAGEPATLTARRFIASFSPDTPRLWCPGNPALTHWLNTYTLLVPGNEGYYIRTLKRCLPMLADPALRDDVENFLLQEGQHGSGHHRCWQLLESQGYRISGFQRPIDWFLYRVMEPVTPLKLRLSMVSCVEHINAYTGHEALSRHLLDDADPAMRALFEWHFAEEIEHKHVAFDVLQALAPSYLLRVLGVAMTVPLFYAATTFGMLRLLAQDRLLFKRSTWSALSRNLFAPHHAVRRNFAHVANYLRPRFHPWQLNDRELAREAIARHSAPEAPRLAPLGPARN